MVVGEGREKDSMGEMGRCIQGKGRRWARSEGLGTF